MDNIVKLSYTASEIDERLGKVNEIKTNIEHFSKTNERQQKEIDGKVTIATFKINARNNTNTFFI